MERSFQIIWVPVRVTELTGSTSTPERPLCGSEDAWRPLLGGVATSFTDCDALSSQRVHELRGTVIQLTGRAGICQTRYLFQVQTGCLEAGSSSSVYGWGGICTSGQYNIFKFNSAFFKSCSHLDKMGDYMTHGGGMGWYLHLWVLLFGLTGRHLHIGAHVLGPERAWLWH